MARTKGKKPPTKEKAPELGGSGAGSEDNTNCNTESGAQQQVAPDKHDFESAHSNTRAIREQFEALEKEAVANAAKMGADGWPDHLTFSALSNDGRGRSFWAIGYPDSLNPKFYDFLSENLQAAVMIHDRDKYSDGKPKKEHLHVIIKDTNKMSWAKVESLCKVLGLVRPEPIMNMVGACRYLAHIDIDSDKRECDKGKVKYNPDDVQTFGGFDYMSQVKATDSDLYKAKKELRGLARLKDATNWATFCDFLDDERPDLIFALSSPGVESSIREYIQANYYRRYGDARLVKAESEIQQLSAIIDHQDDLAAETKGYIAGLQMVLGMMGFDQEKMAAIEEAMTAARAQGLMSKKKDPEERRKEHLRAIGIVDE